MQTALAQTDSQTLVFVLDGALRNTPMAALYDGERYLVEDYAIALSPGLQLLGPRPLQSTQVSALLGGLTESRHGFSALSNVDNEIQTIQALLKSRVLLNQDFTTTALTQQVANADQTDCAFGHSRSVQLKPRRHLHPRLGPPHSPR